MNTENMMEATADKLAMLDATADIGAKGEIFSDMEATRAHVKIVHWAQRRVSRVAFNNAKCLADYANVKSYDETERETFGAEYTDNTHKGRYCGASFATIQEIGEWCEHKGYYADNLLGVKEGKKTVYRLWTVGDMRIAA